MVRARRAGRGCEWLVGGAGGCLEEALLPPDGKRAVVGDGVAVQLEEDVAWQLIRR